MLLGIVLHGMLSFVGWPVWPVQDVHQSESYAIVIGFIHGFRMPLFFFVSGFFTMMTWKRNGTTALLVGRFQRIALPFLIFGIFLIPILNQMPAVAEFFAPQENLSHRILPGMEPSKNIISNSLIEPKGEGASRAIAQGLADGAKTTQKAQKGYTPLHLAVMAGQAETVEFLIKQGADLNARDQRQATPLVWACFLGHYQCAEKLLEMGADPSLRNKDGFGPAEVTFAGRQLSEFLIREVLKVPFHWQGIQEGRMKIRGLLRKTAGTKNPETGGFRAWFAQNYLTYGKFMTHHLWFLYDLLYLVAAFVLVATTFRLLPATKLRKCFEKLPLVLLLLLPLTFWAQYSMKELWGADTSVWLSPDWVKLGYYGIFFGFGCLCHCFSMLDRVGRLWPLALASSLTLFGVCLHFMGNEDSTWSHAALSLSSALFAWLMIFGCLGAFRRFFPKESPQVRFLSDSSYWTYLMHLPLIQVFQAMVSHWVLPSFIKFLLVFFLSSAILLFTYRHLVRYSWIGTILNGKRRSSHEAN